MAKYRGDKYVIERDERDCGGTLIRLAVYDDWRKAKDAWFSIPDPCGETTLCFTRLCNGIDGPGYCLLIDCKCK